MVPTYVDRRINVNDSKCFRIMVAKKQQEMKPVIKKTIIQYVNEYLKLIGIESVKNPEVNLKDNPIKRGFYHNIEQKYGLVDKRDIIWMKFTQGTPGFLGVVAVGTDINFSYNVSSGKIISVLKEQWDESFVLIFPLVNIPAPLNRHLIESGIGNYLISKEIPILDYYSHNM